MPRDLAEKYRPKSLESIFGQENAVLSVRRYLAEGQTTPLLLCGPAGTGKTTAARIIGMARQCLGDVKPCGKCDNCTGINGNAVLGYKEFDGARFNTPQNMTDASSYLFDFPIVGTFTVFVDELHSLPPGTPDKLLKAVEHRNPRSSFVGATTDYDQVYRPLRARCQVIHFHALRPAKLYALLTIVCEKEAIRYEPKALEMISVAAEGSAREALQHLDGIDEAGAVNAEAAADFFSLGSHRLIFDFLRAVVDNDIAAQDQVMADWSAEPVRIAKMIRDALSYLYNYEIAPTRMADIVNPIFFLVQDEERAAIVAGFRARAQALGVPLITYATNLIDLWEVNPQTLTDRSSLMIKVRRFDQIVNGYLREEGPVTSAEPPQRAASTSREYRSRSIRRLGEVSAAYRPDVVNSFLSLRQAEQIYDMASMLPQLYGVLFNAKVIIRHQGLGISKPRHAQKLVSDLTHALYQQTKLWSAGQTCHWIYLHRMTPAGMVSTIITHLPTAALERADGWVSAWFAKRFPGQDAPSAFDADVQRPDLATGNDRRRFQRHWSFVRNLWGAIDPEILHKAANGSRVPLLDLLTVEKTVRLPLGDLGGIRAFGASRSLGPNIRSEHQKAGMGFPSGFRDAAWEAIPQGWELKEHEDRLKELLDRADQEERVRLEFPGGTNPLEKAHQKRALQALAEKRPADPRRRLRSWGGWWTF